MKKLTPKQIGPLFSLVGMIGTSCEQICAHPEMPRKLVRQAECVKRWADESIDRVAGMISDATVRKMTKHGHAFSAECQRQHLSIRGAESAPMVCARLMAGHYGAEHHIKALGLRGPWKEMERTAYTLLKYCMEGPMGGYEEKMFAVAERMAEEVAA